MVSIRRASALAVAAWLLAGCASKDAWMGAEAEKTYDKALEVKRMAAILNNDDYYQIRIENRIYVLSDAKDFTGLLKTGEVPKTVTRIGGGPRGERLVFGLTGNESKAMEKQVGYKGGAEEMYSGNREGLAVGFFGLFSDDGRYVVTDDWSIAKQFPKGVIESGGTSGRSPDGKTVTYLVKGNLKDVEAQFAALFPPQ
jgi:hypothetical protein